MTDFLITMMTLYPWFTWLLVIFAVIGIGYGSLWLSGGIMFASDWASYRRLVWRSKAAVRRQLLENGSYDCAVCAQFEAERLTAMMLSGGNHPRPPDGQSWESWAAEKDWDGPGEDWSPAAEYGGAPMAGLAEMLTRANDAGLLDDDVLPDGPPAERTGPPLCDDPECDKYGWVHPPPCLVLPTMPVPQFTDPAGPAGPPVPWSGLAASLETLARGDGDPVLHPKVAAELGHDTTEGAMDSIFTRAQAREVQAMITDGVIIDGRQE